MSKLFSKHTFNPFRFKPKKSKWRFLYWIIYLTVAAGVIGAFFSAALIIIINTTLPSMDELKTINLAEATEILDRNGEILYSIQGEENRKYVPLSEISQNLVNATIAIEDDEFYTHPGFDIPGLIKALGNEFLGIGGKRGGSTITQQFVKNYFLTSEHTYTRKLKELILAVKIENALEKNQILELYLNKIPYGQNSYGIQQASQTYFKKDAKDLTVAESAVLGALPQAPSYYSPYGAHRHTTLDKEFTIEELQSRPIKLMTDLNEDEFTQGLLGKTYTLTDGSEVYLLGRADIVLYRMKTLSNITEKEYLAATEEIENVIDFTPHRETIVAPHFVFYVREYLEEKYGKDIVEQGGLRVYTTIDKDLQVKAEEIVEAQAAKNMANYEASNGALLATNPQTGQILAMVGSANYFDNEINGQVNITNRALQPGSSFKPLVYAAAFLSRATPATVVYDVGTKFGTSDQKVQNFDGKFLGPVSLRQGLGLSRNIPAIKALYLAGGESPIVELATKMGITTLKDDGNYGISLALGSGETKMTEMVQAFGVFANGGQLQKLTPILKIENTDGEILEQWELNDEKEEVLDPQVAYLITNVLSDPAIHVGNQLRVAGHQVAAKTGTANKKIKNGNILPSNTWTIGYTPNFVVATWAGNSDGKEMKWDASGYACAAPIFHQFLTYALKDKKMQPFTIPSGIKHITVSKASGFLPSSDTPGDQVKAEVFASFAIPAEQDDRFYRVNLDSLSKRIATEFTPKYLVETKVFRVHRAATDNMQWQQGINDYVAQMRLKEPDNQEYAPFPTETDHIHTAKTQGQTPSLTIISPSNFSSVKAGNIAIEVNASAPLQVESVKYYMNDELQYTAKEAPYTGRIRIHPSTTSGTLIKVKAIIEDHFGYRDEKNIEFKIE
ncbi:transglycosylase domain-containing protein [Patescibacteria group bacterium]|nr:transglycosylase domain-containing protein [Patescibacteria group bacterium]